MLCMWFKGPEALPKFKFAFSAFEINSFEFLMDSSREYPKAKLDAMALERVHPVPWVFSFSIFSPLNQVVFPL